MNFKDFIINEYLAKNIEDKESAYIDIVNFMSDKKIEEKDFECSRLDHVEFFKFYQRVTRSPSFWKDFRCRDEKFISMSVSEFWDEFEGIDNGRI